MWRAFILVLLLGLPSLVSAAPYYEFAPDYSQPIAVQPGSSVEQIFLPLNDRISIIELWLSTGASAATIDASLLNASGTAVATRTLSLGVIDDTPGGTRTKIILPAQVSVDGSQPYRLRITPSGGTVNIYYSGSLSAVPGMTSGESSAYEFGAAVIGGVEQGYSFKFALTEATETTKPALSSVSVTQPSIGQAILSFNASEPADASIVYGSRTAPYTNQYTPCLSGVSVCIVPLSVTPGNTYSYTLTVRDVWGNEQSTQGSFTAVGIGPQDTVVGGPTAPPATPTATTAPPTPLPSATDDETPPAITDPRLISLTPMTATFAWTTNEPASTWIVILVLPELRALSGTLDNTLELEHYVTMVNLPADQYLRARMTSADQFGNSSTVNIDFKTPAQTTEEPGATVSPGTTPTPSPEFSIVPSASPSGSASPTPPLPSDTLTPIVAPATSTTPTPSVIVSPSTSTEPGVITWTPASGDVDGYRIDIFDADNNLVDSLYVGADKNAIALPAGVGEGARIIVYADRGGAFEKVGPPVTLTSQPSATDYLETSPLALAGGGILIIALTGAWLYVRHKQKVNATPTTIGLGIGPRA